jgi:hypothetical protein
MGRMIEHVRTLQTVGAIHISNSFLNIVPPHCSLRFIARRC